MNKVILVGKLIEEVEVRHSPRELAVTNLKVETAIKVKDHVKTEQHSVVAFGKLAEICGSHLKKDGQVYIEGRSKKRSWEKEGVTRYTTEVIASNILLLGSGDNLGVNKAIYIGRLGANPEIRYTNDGLAVAILSLATNEKNGDKNETQWHRIIVIGKLAEICERYLDKGRQICIEGRIQTRSWEKSGNTYSISEVIASRMEMLGSKPGNAEAPEGHIIESQSLNNHYLEDDIPF